MSDSPQKKRRKPLQYSQVYLKRREEIFTWVKPGPSEKCAFCTLCRKNFSISQGGQFDPKQHAQYKVHQMKEKASHIAMAMHPDQPDIAAYYESVIGSIAKKTLLRMEPMLKRTVCKGCQGVLLPGVTAHVRVCQRPVHCVLWTCSRCFTRRRFPSQRGYQLWAEKPEAVVP